MSSLEQKNILARNYSISLIRFVSMIFIILCHIMQYYEMELAWWFNVGVQIFLCISGFLYAQKEIYIIPDFYTKCFRKILVPYYVVVVIATIVTVLFARAEFDIQRTLESIFCHSTIFGGEHLWFIATILMCYVITPLLQSYRDKFSNGAFGWGCFLIGALFIVFVFFEGFATFFNPAWISCYVIGYCLGDNEKKKYFSSAFMMIVFGIIALLGNSIQIYVHYLNDFELSGNLATVYSIFRNYNHCWLGVFLFLLMKLLFDKINFVNYSKIIKLLDITDSYSYEIYLVHQFLILGPFSIMAITSASFVNVILVMIGIILLSAILKCIENGIFSFWQE